MHTLKAVLILAALVLSGCATANTALGNNEAVIVAIGGALTQQGCTAAAKSAKLQPAELSAIAAAVNSCSTGISAAIPAK